MLPVSSYRLDVSSERLNTVGGVCVRVLDCGNIRKKWTQLGMSVTKWSWSWNLVWRVSADQRKTSVRVLAVQQSARRCIFSTLWMRVFCGTEIRRMKHVHSNRKVKRCSIFAIFVPHVSCDFNLLHKGSCPETSVCSLIQKRYICILGRVIIFSIVHCNIFVVEGMLCDVK